MDRLGWLTLLLTLFLVACGGGDDSGAAADADGVDEEEEIAVPVETASVSEGQVFAAYAGTTVLESDVEADVVAKTSGVILELLVEEGDPVKANQVVARLDRERVELEVAESQATLNRLENDFRRYQELHEKKLISAEAFERSRFDLAQQKAAHDMRRLELSYTEVRSPIAGVISRRMVKQGKLVALHEALFTVNNFDPLLAVIHVPERELAVLAPGQTVELNVDALGTESFTGELARISPVVDSDTGTFKVTIEMPAPDPRLKPGMFGRINIIYDIREQAITIPQEALVVEDRERYVYRVTDDGRAERVDVAVGYITAGQVEVREGLSPGERVVTAGKGSISDDTLLDLLDGGGPSQLAESPTQESSAG
ncbi:MAG: efflux RND transporter periplasmic adaptor subunit [Pseudomonadota bacterium]